MIKTQQKSFSFSVPRFSSRRSSLGTVRPISRSSIFHETQNELIHLNEEIRTTNATLDFLEHMDYNWFSDIRFIGTALVLKQLSNMLKIMQHKLKTDLDHENVPKDIFSWYMDDFLNRKDMQHSVYLKQARTKGKKNIDMIKLMADIDTINDCCNRFYLDLVNETNFTGESIRDIINLIRLQGMILQNEKYHDVTLKMIRYKLKNFNTMKSSEMQKADKEREKYYNIHFNDIIIKFPIEYRYVTKYDYARIRLLEKQQDITEEDYLTQIDYYNDKYIGEQECFNLIATAYEVQIERLNDQLHYWNDKYSTEYEEYDIQISRNTAELEEIAHDVKKKKQIYEKCKRDIEKHLATEKKVEDDLINFILGLKDELEEEAPSKHKKGKDKGKGKRKGKGNEKRKEQAKEDLEKPKKETEHKKEKLKKVL